jgi:hypothetical protein
MPTCPAGHDSSGTDFCDVCGIRLAAPAQPQTGSRSAGPTGPVASPDLPGSAVPPLPAAAVAGAAPPGSAVPPLPAAVVPGAAAPAASPAAPQGQPCPQCGTPRTGPFCEVCGYNFATGAVRVTTAPSYLSPLAGHPPTVPSKAVGPAAAPPAPGNVLAGPGGATAAPGTAPAGPAGPAPGPAVPPASPGAVPVGSSPGLATGSGPNPAAPTPAPTPTPVPTPAAADAGAWTAVVTADRAYFDSVVAANGPDAGALEFPAYCPERRFRLQGPEMRIGRRSASRGLEPEIDLTGPPTDPGVSHLHAVLVAETDGGWAVFDPGSANGTQVNGNEIVAGARVRLRDGDRVCVGAWTVLTIRLT